MPKAPRNIHVHILLNASENDALSLLVEDSGLRRGDIIRQLIREAVKARKQAA